MLRSVDDGGYSAGVELSGYTAFVPMDSNAVMGKVGLWLLLRCRNA